MIKKPAEPITLMPSMLTVPTMTSVPAVSLFNHLCERGQVIPV